jgi:hypothetical protein
MSDESDWDHWLDELIEASPRLRLSAWERSFLESLDEQRGNGRQLSERQAEILERIHTEKWTP